MTEAIHVKEVHVVRIGNSDHTLIIDADGNPYFLTASGLVEIRPVRTVA